MYQFCLPDDQTSDQFYRLINSVACTVDTQIIIDRIAPAPVSYTHLVSGLGKGITAASLGRLLKARGYKVTMQKFDPYINIDPGVYIMHDKTDAIIYIGKAVSLRKRVRQYFQPSQDEGIKKKQMVEHIARFEYIRCV